MSTCVWMESDSDDSSDSDDDDDDDSDDDDSEDDSSEMDTDWFSDSVIISVRCKEERIIFCFGFVFFIVRKKLYLLDWSGRNNFNKNSIWKTLYLRHWAVGKHKKSCLYEHLPFAMIRASHLRCPLRASPFVPSPLAATRSAPMIRRRKYSGMFQIGAKTDSMRLIISGYSRRCESRSGRLFPHRWVIFFLWTEFFLYIFFLLI